MNLDRYEKIDGREALKRLVNGETVFNWRGDSYQIEGGLVIEKTGKGNEFCANLTLNGVIGADGWYIPKPFDVRQAMLDRPYEWVAAYPNHEGKWFKIGFVSASMSAVVEELEWEGPPFWQHVRARPHLLDNCIPIEDVPEEATR